MPMYEKGSVRAEPRSKQQERMKKIMKKFLSSLLALTMVLSLVVVPARAADSLVNDGAYTVTLKGSSKESAKVGDDVTFVANIPASVKVSDGSTEYEGTVSYSWSIGNAYRAKGSTTSSEFTATAKSTASSGNLTKATCEFTITYSTDKTIKVSKSVSLPVVDAQYDFESSITKIIYESREYTISKSDENPSDWTAEIKYVGDTAPTTGFSTNVRGVTATLGGDNTTLTLSNGTNSKALTLTRTKVNLTAPGITATGVTSNTIREGEKGVLTANYTSTLGTADADLTYEWYNGTNKIARSDSKTLKLDDKLTFPASNTPYSITVKVKDNGVTKESDAYSLTVNADTHKVLPDYSYTTMATGESQLLKLTVKDGTKTNTNPTLSTVWSVENGKDSYISLSAKTDKQATATAGSTSGRVTVTAVVTYLNKDYTVEFPIKIEALDDTIASVTNGDLNSYDDSELESLVAKIIQKKDSSFTASKVQKITLETAPSTMLELYGRNSFTSSHKYSKGDTISDLYISAKAGYLGEDSFQLKVYSTQNGVSPYIVTLKVPVVGDKTIKDTVTGTSAGKSVTFTNSDYKYLYYTTSKVTDYEGHFDGTSVTGYTLVKEDKDVTITASQFGNNNSVTLYVVGVDKDYVASTGTITVSQKSYDINYNVVAGKSVSFNQKDFEDFLEDYADDNGDYNSRKDELSFDHAVLTSSIPSAKSEGTLYYGSTEITSSNKSKTDMTDMDKVSFDSVSKPSKDTVTLTFRVYGEIEKPNSRKPDKVNYDVNVVISVVKEDITYTVGIDDTVQLTARDFVNFLQDARTSYRKAELDYVKFDVSGKNVSSYAYGGLYRSYSSYSTGKLADSTDKFYYEPSRTQYDLADVAYHTTRWAEAGKTVYIPFTVYGTKNEEASGTMAITIAQTMNFIDVKASDFFYEPVKWAVNNKITNGTSSTTFSPYKNCNRAEIVTFLWRAAGSPEPTVTRNPFTDVNSVRDASYYKAILWASQKGITAGTTATTFSPYQECTRSQIVTFLYRYAGKPSGYYSNPFKDVSSVNEASYYNAILWAVGKGITQGTSTTTFSPYASCTRGEAVTFLYRYVNGVK